MQGRIASTPFASILIASGLLACSTVPDDGPGEDEPDAHLRCSLGQPDCCERTRNPGDRRGQKDCFDLDLDEYRAVCDRAPDDRLGTCIHLCVDDADCADPLSLHQEVDCGLFGCGCVTGACTPKPCTRDQACPPGTLCIKGDCVTPERQPDHCDIAPHRIHVRPGASFSLTGRARYDGRPNRTTALYRWQSEAGDVVSVSGGPGPTARAEGGAVAGDTRIVLEVGTGRCTVPATNHGPPPADAMRIIVVDASRREGITGAKVLLSVGGEVLASGQTSERGVVHLPRPDASTWDIHVLAPWAPPGAGGHKHVSLVAMAEPDLLVVLPPNASAAAPAVTGTLSEQDFALLSGDTVHVSVHGTSVPEHVLDLSLDHFLGELTDTRIEFGSLIDEVVPWPGTFVFGIGEQFFNDTYRAFAFPGRRTAWSYGGNLSFSETVAAAGSTFLNDPSVGEFVRAGLQAPAERMHVSVLPDAVPEGPDGLPADLHLPPTLPARMVLSAAVPALPGSDRNRWWYTDVSFVLAALVTVVEGEGLVPLGFRGASNAPDFDGRHVYDGDPFRHALEPGHVALRAAPPGSGLSDGPYHLVFLAFEPRDMSWPERRTPDRVSALIVRLEDVPWNATVAPPTAFMPFANDGFDVATRTFTPEPEGEDTGEVADLPAPPIDILRLSVAGTAGEGWVVYLPGDHTEAVTLPSLEDRLCVHGPCLDPVSRSATYRVERLATVVPYETLLRFDDRDIGRLFGQLRAFSSARIAP